MTSTRRDIFKFAGGAAVGALFTPAPWRLIADSARWSENWPGIPAPARGETRVKYTNCPLCPAGCAVRARCVGEQPVVLAGARGGLCPFGLTAHHLPYHPARLRHGPVGQAAAAVAGAIARRGPAELVAVLDPRPGRTASWTFRRAMAAVNNGVYLAGPRPAIAVNLANARTVLSLGAPLLDGWGTPANVFAARERFRLIQVEAVESRTAALADDWLAVRPGSEEPLTLALAGAISESDAAQATGLPARRIAALRNELKENGPALAVDQRMSPAVVALNIQLRGWGGTIGPRREPPVPRAWKKAPAPTELRAVADGSIRVLLIDESVPGEYVPWEEIEPKLADNPVVVAFAWSKGGYGRYAQYVLPAAVYPELTDDVPAAVDRIAADFRIAAPLVAAPPGMVNASHFIAEAAGLPPGDALRERSDAIHRAGRGTLLSYADGKTTSTKDVTADDFWKALNAGGCWTGGQEPCGKPPAPKPAIAALPAARKMEGDRLPFQVVMADRAAAGPMVSPLMSKLYEESNLRLPPNRVALHPTDAARCNVRDGGRAMLQTRTGKWEVDVVTDTSVRPGVVVSARPEHAGAEARVVCL